jgi:branched-chain amino acid transport system substrate-binding protein
MNFTKHALGTLCGAMLLTGAAWAQKGETVKIAWIDPLSGPFANIGQNQPEELPVRRREGQCQQPCRREVRGRLVRQQGPPQESLNALKAAIDQGIRYVTQGNGSGAAGAIIDAINKHNERNPGKEVVYLNNAAVDPDLTNSKCSFWHFRFDADTSMKMEALTTFMKDEKPDVKKVYLHRPELCARPSGRQVRQGGAGPQAPRRADRRRRPAPARLRCATSRPTSPRSRPRAPTR